MSLYMPYFHILWQLVQFIEVALFYFDQDLGTLAKLSGLQKSAKVQDSFELYSNCDIQL